ncbi:hypothetical protein Cgig2_004179 [Carnegiea gigantea]|uniref:Germin-like protein n=1 Tax=Carnegiea gigantea TaxID=171969 RepID=A0A9Q1KUF4_9CARY|nr:hypothetical protein Cgig2_004179 [Carnegiea gigantea]
MEMSFKGITIASMAFAMSLTLFVANAADPNPLQDFCVGVPDPHAAVGDTNNLLRSRAVMVNATLFPALNTLGVAMARIDYEAGGVNPPHLHPRASEMLVVLEGTLYAGFVTSNLQAGGNRLYSKVLNKGDIFVFPQGLIHFQLNIGSTPAVANAAFGSQTPGLVTVANAVFGSTPPILEDVLTKGFQVDEKVIGALRAQFRPSDQPDFHSYI